MEGWEERVQVQDDYYEDSIFAFVVLSKFWSDILQLFPLYELYFIYDFIENKQCSSLDVFSIFVKSLP